jgi:tRNA (cytidine/uridine-2'-O-)-methyltransferase
LHVVLVNPEIPQNTGNIGRLCVATSTPLHLVGTLGFRIDDKAVRRAGLDYWPDLELHRHVDLAHFRNRHPGSRCWFFTARAEHSWFDVDMQADDSLVFGCESVGLPDDILEANADWLVGIPTSGKVRSHNLANAVSIALYEALRKLGALRANAIPGADGA